VGQEQSWEQPASPVGLNKARIHIEMLQVLVGTTSMGTTSIGITFFNLQENFQSDRQLLSTVFDRWVDLFTAWIYSLLLISCTLGSAEHCYSISSAYLALLKCFHQPGHMGGRDLLYEP
jgi:hypothetical protein